MRFGVWGLGFRVWGRHQLPFFRDVGPTGPFRFQGLGVLGFWGLGCFFGFWGSVGVGFWGLWFWGLEVLGLWMSRLIGVLGVEVWGTRLLSSPISWRPSA